jgi:SAM-dependent methyltransferase
VTGRGVGLKERFYPESRFGGFSNVDGTVAFYGRVNALLQPDAIVVDAGCGRGAYSEDPVAFRRELRIFKGRAARVIGLDVDDAGELNPYLDEFYRLAGPEWPLVDNQADMVISDSVVEHLEQPAAFFCEAARVLKNGGFLCIRTANLWGYPAMIARMVPNRSHTAVLERVKEQAKEEDVFPTYYRCNTIPTLRRFMSQYGFEHIVFGFGPEPAYLSFSKVAYGLGVLYQKIAPRFVQPVLFAFGQLRKV